MDWFLYDKDKDKRFKIKAPSKACYSFFLKRCIINSGPIVRLQVKVANVNDTIFLCLRDTSTLIFVVVFKH